MSGGTSCAVPAGAYKVAIGDRALSAVEAGREAGLSPDTIRKRLRRGLPAEEVMRPRNSGLVPNGLTPAERQKLVVSVIPWCRKAARQQVQALARIGRRDVDFEELESEAYVAACQAAEFWRDGMGATFLSYARTWIGNRFKEATDTRRVVAADHHERPDLFEDRDENEAPAADHPDADAQQKLAVLREPARTIVRAVVFERLSPDQVAIQLGMAVKDVKLIMRNSARQIEAAQSRAKPPGRAVDALATLELAADGYDVAELVAG